MCTWVFILSLCTAGCPSGRDQPPGHSIRLRCYPCDAAKENCAEELGVPLEDLPIQDPEKNPFLCKFDIENRDESLDQIKTQICPEFAARWLCNLITPSVPEIDLSRTDTTSFHLRYSAHHAIFPTMSILLAAVLLHTLPQEPSITRLLAFQSDNGIYIPLTTTTSNEAGANAVLCYTYSDKWGHIENPNQAAEKETLPVRPQVRLAKSNELIY
ncbi:hypothetical protein V8F20_012027 [Naviculisporaceae sp. PSN 640]